MRCAIKFCFDMWCAVYRMKSVPVLRRLPASLLWRQLARAGQQTPLAKQPCVAETLSGPAVLSEQAMQHCLVCPFEPLCAGIQQEQMQLVCKMLISGC